MKENTSLIFAFLLAVGFVLPATAQPVPDGLIAHYPFNGNALDESDYDNDGTVNDATLTTDRCGNPNSAYTFDGLNDYIKVPYDPSLYPSSITLSAWFRLTSQPTSRVGLLSNTGSGINPPYDPYRADILPPGILRVQIEGNSSGNQTGYSIQLDSPAPVSLHDWHHFAAYYDATSGNAVLYFDGATVAQDNVQMTLDANTLGFILGSGQNTSGNPIAGQYFPGDIDDVQLYNRALSDTEVQTLFVSGGCNQPPTADAGADQATECTSSTGATIALDGTNSMDPDGDVLTYTWSDAGGTILATGAISTVVLPLGTHTLTLIVDDGNGGTDTDEVEITVEDTTPPIISLATGPIELWPPNHKYHTIDLAALVTGTSDACDATTGGDVLVISASSDEPENGSGDGNTMADIVISGDCRSVDLRAERQGGSNGRVYTLHLGMTDASGNEGTASYQVNVPKSKKSDSVDDEPAYVVSGCIAAPKTSVTASSPLDGPKIPLHAIAEVPTAWHLHPNYPNPFNPQTAIRFDLPEAVHVRLVVYDVTGREIARLVNGPLRSGTHTVTFDAAGLPSGVYVYRLDAGSFTQTRHMVLLK